MMYSLSIHFGPSPVPAQFLFKDSGRAAVAYTKIRDAIKTGLMAEIEDDYGATGTFGSITGYFLEDMDLGEESRIQRGLSQARGQAKANERAKTDPILLKAMGVRGPSVLTPFGNGQFGNG